MTDTIIRKGFGLKNEIQETLQQEYYSQLIDQIKGADYTLTRGNITIKLAKEYGFCYGVDRSIDYAYQTVEKFPGKKIYLTGEIIHNPFVNKRLIERGVRFLSGPYNQGENLANIAQEDVVILPAVFSSIQPAARF
jgi:4-hydroxy-3-methylbut-2-enyl diphosphate reductase